MRPPDVVATEPWWYLQGGLYRSPYVTPLQHDVRVLARLPAAFQVPTPPHSADRAEGFVRHWGVLPLDVVGPEPSTVQTAGVHTVGSDPERVRWCDSTRCHRRIDLTVSSRVWELARCEVPSYAVGTLERVATFLRAQALSPGGAVLEDFVTTIDTPLCAEIVHPMLAERLSVRWHLREHNGQVSRPLVAAPANQLPVCGAPEGLPLSWDDFRYQWQGRYTVDLKSVLRTSVVRLFAELSAPTPARWIVNVGGLMSMWTQTANPYDNATARRGAITR